MVCAACCHLALVFAVMHLYNIYSFCIASIHSFFLLNLVLINRQNGSQYQRVLALCAFLTGMIPTGLILQKFCVPSIHDCVCFVLCKLVYRTDFVVFE